MHTIKANRIAQLLTDTRGRRLSIQWTKRNGEITTARNAHLPSRAVCKEGARDPKHPNNFRLHSHNDGHLITVALDQVNFIQCGEITYGARIAV